jgi:hypothetical protein
MWLLTSLILNQQIFLQGLPLPLRLTSHMCAERYVQ